MYFLGVRLMLSIVTFVRVHILLRPRCRSTERHLQDQCSEVANNFRVRQRLLKRILFHSASDVVYELQQRYREFDASRRQ
jgi:hypothetical protein